MLRQGGAKGLVVLSALILMGVTAVGCAADTTGVSAGGQATVTPMGTPKPGIREDAAVLGGAVYAFDKKFGSSNCCYRNGWDYQGPYGPMWTGVWYRGHATSAAMDEQSKDRVTAISNASAQDTTALWTVSQADAICNPFLPPDAKYEGTTTVKDIAGSVAGVEKRYTSPLLAETLPASDFTDVNGHAVTPGTFYMYYVAQYNGSPTMLVAWCVLSTDENSAQNL